MVVSLNDNVALLIDSLCPHPNIRDQSITKSELQYLISEESCL